VAECRNYREDNSSFSAIPGKQDFLTWSTPLLLRATDITLDDCDVLERHINPYCSFAAPWTQKINSEIQISGEYTIEFWWKALRGTKLATKDSSWTEDTETMKRIIFFFKMAPLELLAEITLYENMLFVSFYGSCSDNEYENMNVGISQFENGRWYKTTITFGGFNVEGKRGVWVFHGSKGGFDFADWQWCRDDGMDFIQGMQLPVGILISPIEVTAAARRRKDIQESHYNPGISHRLRAHARSIVWSHTNTHAHNTLKCEESRVCKHFSRLL